jgi:hypothetical protein
VPYLGQFECEPALSYHVFEFKIFSVFYSSLRRGADTASVSPPPGSCWLRSSRVTATHTLIIMQKSSRNSTEESKAKVIYKQGKGWWFALDSNPVELWLVIRNNLSGSETGSRPFLPQNRQSARLFLQSSELGHPHPPSSQARVPPPPPLLIAIYFHTKSLLSPSAALSSYLHTFNFHFST